jgi:hypothetical protein
MNHGIALKRLGMTWRYDVQTARESTHLFTRNVKSTRNIEGGQIWPYRTRNASTEDSIKPTLEQREESNDKPV